MIFSGLLNKTNRAGGLNSEQQDIFETDRKIELTTKESHSGIGAHAEACCLPNRHARRCKERRTSPTRKEALWYLLLHDRS